MRKKIAIKKSVEHWHRMIVVAKAQLAAGPNISMETLKDIFRKKLGEVPDSDNCPLCQKYDCGNCRGCPYSKTYGSCTSGLYNAYNTGFGRQVKSVRQWIRSAEKVEAQLESLLYLKS